MKFKKIHIENYKTYKQLDMDLEADWTQANLVSRVMGREILRGKDILMKEGGLEEWLTFIPLRAGKSAVL